MSGLHNSHPNVIASQSYVWTNISFKSAPFYETIGGSLSILLSNGCCWIKCQFCISIWFQLGDNVVWKSKIYVFWLGSYVVGQIFSPHIQCIIWVVEMKVSGYPLTMRFISKMWNCSFKCCFRGVDSEKSKCFTL